jgi:glycosyltransferase involved in cell wall biosynthesis
MKAEPSNTKTLAIVDPIWGGHSPTYFLIYWRVWMESDRLQKGKVNLIGFSPQPEQTQQLLAENGFANADIRLMNRPIRDAYPDSMMGQAKFALANWSSLKDAFSRAEAGNGTKIDFALILWLDPFLAAFAPGFLVDRIFAWPWAGLYLQPFTFRIQQSRRWRLLAKFFPGYGAACARQCRAALTLDEGIAAAMTSALNKPVVAMPDVTDVTVPDPANELAREIRSKGGHLLVVGSIGVLSKRKGVLTLIEAAKLRIPGWFFVFAGPLSETEFSPAELSAIKEFAGRAPDNCLFRFASIPDGAAFNAVIAACDVLYANYRCFSYSSNILTKAALFQKPVIVSDQFLIAERTAKFQMGWCLPEDDLPALTDYLKRTDRAAVAAKKEVARFADYRAEHSEARLNSVLDQLIAHVGI